MSINKIKKEDNPDLFEMFIDDVYETSFKEHRKESNFWIELFNKPIELNDKYK